MKSMGRGFCVDENSGILYSLQMEYGKRQGAFTRCIDEGEKEH